jgi:hypothetical protein
MISSLLDGSSAPSSGPGDDGQSTSGWTAGTDTPSEISTPDFDQNALDDWLSILNAFPDPQSNEDRPSMSSVNYDIDSLLSSISTDFPMHHDPNLITHDNTSPAHSVGDSITHSANMNLHFAIDPVLLAMSMPTSTQLPSHGLPSEPALTISPIESESVTTESLTPQADISFSEPETHMGEQGMSIEAAQDLFVAQMVANQDPMMAASTLLQFASAAAPSPSSNIMTPSVAEHIPRAGIGNIHQPALRPTYDFFQQPSNTPTEGPTAPTSSRAFQATLGSLRPMPAANKQDILARAKERRRQLVGEIDRAKVELWETTIEQGVLAQLVKEKL